MIASIKILIADDHTIFRSGLAALLRNIPRIRIIRQAENGKEVLTILEKEPIDIVLMDISMPVMDGIEATGIISQKYPQVKVIALSMHDDQNSILEMNANGAVGYLLKNTNIHELKDAIFDVMRGERYFSKEVSLVLLNKTVKTGNNKSVSLDPLSGKDKELIIYLSKGFSAIEIAEKLGVAEKTVEGHKSKLFQKTGVKNTTALVMYAVKHGII